MSEPGHNYRFGGPSKTGWPTFYSKGKKVKTLRIYICGPMRGYEHHNFPAFDAAASNLRTQGHIVINPADLDRAVGVGPETEEVSAKLLAGMARRDYEAILGVDAIVLLPGWDQSRGAKAESRFGLDINVSFFLYGPRGGLAPISKRHLEIIVGRGF